MHIVFFQNYRNLIRNLTIWSLGDKITLTTNYLYSLEAILSVTLEILNFEYGLYNFKTVFGISNIGWMTNTIDSEWTRIITAEYGNKEKRL